MASCTRGPGRYILRLRTLAAALLVAQPGVTATIAAAWTAPEPPLSLRPAAATRFSELTELTPVNVHGLLPLVARTRTVPSPQLPSQRQFAHPLQVTPSVVDGRLQRFLAERAGQLELVAPERARLEPIGGTRDGVVSYVLGSVIQDEPAARVRGQLELRAWNPIERRALWSVQERLPISAPTLVTAGGLIFYGTGDGWLKALDAHTGRTLWQHRVDGSRLEEPISYRGADGHQNIAVRSRPRGRSRGGDTLLIFALAH